MTNDFNEAISAAVRAEHRARGWSVEELGERLPAGDLSARTLYRLLSTKTSADRKKPEWKASYIASVAEALGMTATELMAATEHRQAQATRPSLGADPRAVITWLLQHPEDDEELRTRLDDIESRTGVRGRRLMNLRETIRTVRREELTQALSVLPPRPSSTSRADCESG